MTREELAHGIRAACDVAGEDTVIVFGSQAILAQFPDAPPELRQSAEMDVSPLRRTDRVDDIDGSLGELSQFHATHGFYVHGLVIEEAVNLPAGWRDRLVEVSGLGSQMSRGLCLEAHDIAATKLAAFRDKDKDYVRVLLVRGMIEADVLVERIETQDLPAEERDRRIRWVRLTEGGR